MKSKLIFDIDIANFLLQQHYKLLNIKRKFNSNETVFAFLLDDFALEDLYV